MNCGAMCLEILLISSISMAAKPRSAKGRSITYPGRKLRGRGAENPFSVEDVSVEEAHRVHGIYRIPSLTSRNHTSQRRTSQSHASVQSPLRPPSLRVRTLITYSSDGRYAPNCATTRGRDFCMALYLSASMHSSAKHASQEMLQGTQQ